MREKVVVIENEIKSLDLAKILNLIMNNIIIIIGIIGGIYVVLARTKLQETYSIRIAELGQNILSGCQGLKRGPKLQSSC